MTIPAQSVELEQMSLDSEAEPLGKGPRQVLDNAFFELDHRTAIATHQVVMATVRTSEAHTATAQIDGAEDSQFGQKLQRSVYSGTAEGRVERPSPFQNLSRAQVPRLRLENLQDGQARWSELVSSLP